jgi:hypothetical protein
MLTTQSLGTNLRSSFLPLFANAKLDYSDHSSMAEQEFNKGDDEKRARGGKRTFETKIAEVSTSKSKTRARKALAETLEPVKAQNIFDDPGRHSEDNIKRSRLERAAKDVADRKITLGELDKALHDAVTERNIRLGGQGAFHNVSEKLAIYEFSMEAFQRLARAIAARRKRTAELMRNARPFPSSGIQPNILNRSVGGSDPSSPITEPQLLASTPHLAAMTPGCATEPPASVSTTVGAYPMLQLYASPFSATQSTHGQRSAAHDPPLVFLLSHSTGRPVHRPLRSHLQRPNNMFFIPASHSRLMGTIQLLMAPSCRPSCRPGSCPATVLAGQWFAHCGSAKHFPALRDGPYGHSAGVRTT